MVDLANNDTAEAHFDEITEAGEAEREMISSRVNDMWSDKETLCRIIVENADDIYQAVNNVYDAEKEVEQLINDAMRVEIEQDLNI